MSVIAVKIKVMPDSPDTNIDEIKVNVEKILGAQNIQNPNFEIQPIAFGLKAWIILFGWPEDKELDDLEEELRKIPNVSSVQVVDIRRAIG